MKTQSRLRVLLGLSDKILNKALLLFFFLMRVSRSVFLSVSLLSLGLLYGCGSKDSAIVASPSPVAVVSPSPSPSPVVTPSPKPVASPTSVSSVSESTQVSATTSESRSDGGSHATLGDFNAEIFDAPSNCRVGPGTGSAVKKSMQSGDILVDRSNPQRDSNGESWYREEYQGCWIHSSQLRFKVGSTSDKPVANVNSATTPKQEAAPARETSGYVAGTCKQLRAMGLSDFRPGDPNYTSKRDRNHEGVGCQSR